MIFCDTSTMAKLYVPERESAAVRKLLEAEGAVYVSELARPELLGVFHRRLRERKWNVPYRAPASNVAPRPSSTPGQDVTYSDACPGSDTSTQ